MNPVHSVLLIPTKPGADLRHTVWGLAALHGIAVIWGIRNSYWWEGSPLDLLVSPLMCASLAWWAIVDARRRQRPIPYLARSWFLLFAPVVVPLYIVGSRTWRGLIFLLIHVGTFLVLWMTSMTLSGIGLFGLEWLEWLAGTA